MDAIVLASARATAGGALEVSASRRLSILDNCRATERPVCFADSSMEPARGVTAYMYRTYIAGTWAAHGSIEPHGMTSTASKSEYKHLSDEF